LPVTWAPLELPAGTCDAAAMDSFANGSTTTLRHRDAVVRFARRHAGEIGEARFDTSSGRAR